MMKLNIFFLPFSSFSVSTFSVSNGHGQSIFHWDSERKNKNEKKTSNELVNFGIFFFFFDHALMLLLKPYVRTSYIQCIGAVNEDIPK